MSPENENSQNADWKLKYASLVASAGRAISKIRPGARVFVGTGCAAPQTLLRALAERGPELADIEVIHLLTWGEAPYVHTELARNFRVNTFFIAENVRQAVQDGLGDYTPIFLSDIPRLFHSGQLPLDAALIQTTPPDESGMCSLGVSVDIVKSAVENASLVIAQVNPQMPRTLGDSFVHVRDLDFLVEGDEPLLEFEQKLPDEVTARIGQYVAGLVEDGATLELGIGRVPHAVLDCLKEKKDLGIHTEMLTDAIVDFVKSGAVTGRMKTLDKGKIVASFCIGTRKLYDFIDNNPLFSFRPTEYVNDPFIISRQRKMTAINLALEVDLTGQVCADSLGVKFFSGIGGHVDFNRGAGRAQDGKAIIAMPSTACDGAVSRIVSQLKPGAGVVTTRGDVHYVATEWGVAYLHGKSVQERALSLIGIAHPDYRARLLHEAVEMRYVSRELSAMEGKILVAPKELSGSMLLDDGAEIRFRPVQPTDEMLLKDLFYQLSQQTIYYRFMTNMTRAPRKNIRDFVYIDHRNEVAIVGALPTPGGEELIALGQYCLDPASNRAETAFVVQEHWQNRGIGKYLLERLKRIAIRNGIRGFTAEVLAENRAMQRVFKESDCKVESRLNGGVYSFILDFEG